MSEKKDVSDPSTTSLAYDVMFPRIQKVNTVLSGTQAMKNAERLYLPQHDEESTAAYLERLSRNVLFNVSSLTLDSWVGRPFSDPVVLNDDIPESTMDIVENIDLLGNNLNVFSRNWFKDGMAKALSHVLIDMPRPRDTEAEEGRQRTLEDDRVEGLRPYWIHIKHEDLIFAHAEIIDGTEVLTEVRILEEKVNQVGFSEEVILGIRRLFLVEQPQDDGSKIIRLAVEMWELQSPGKGKRKPKWVVVDGWVTDIDFIPLVTFYADRENFMIGKPPLEDLVDLNIAWWQSNSDQRAILTVARFPMLALSGGTDDNNKLRVGPHEWLYVPDAQGKFYYVEHSGKAIEAGRKDLQDLEMQMSEYGAEFLKKRPGNLTATARALDSAEATSPLQDATIRFIDAMNTALDYTQLWLGQPIGSGGTVMISTDFGPEDADATDMNTLRETRKMRDISRRTYLGELQRRGLLGDEFNFDIESQLLEDEMMLMEGGGLGDIEDEETPEEKLEREQKEAEGEE